MHLRYIERTGGTHGLECHRQLQLSRMNSTQQKEGGDDKGGTL